MASMVGAQRRYRRPLLGGVASPSARPSSPGSSRRPCSARSPATASGSRRSSRSSRSPMLLLILNWFYHRVYWQEHLAELHGKKKTMLQGAGLSLAAAQVAGLVALGFTSVYREGFETVLFLQALTLEAGAWTVLEGVALGFAAVVARLLPRHRARAEAAAQEDADRDGPDDHLGARRARRADRPDDAEGRLGARDADRGPRPAVLVRASGSASTRRGRAFSPRPRRSRSCSAATSRPRRSATAAARGSSPRRSARRSTPDRPSVTHLRLPVHVRWRPEAGLPAGRPRPRPCPTRKEGLGGTMAPRL